MTVASATKSDWKTLTLSDVCLRITDGTHKTPNYVDRGVRFISIKNIRPFQPISFKSYEKYITPEEHEELTRRAKPEIDDILFPRIGTLGFAKRIDFDEEVSIFVGLGLLKPDKSKIRPKYLEYWMNSPLIHRLSHERANGSGRLTLPLEETRKFPVLVPPLDAQDTIVAEIEKQFTRLDAGVTSLKRVQTALKRYRASVLKAACEGKFPREAISVAIHSLDQGWSPKCESVPSPSNDVWAVIKTSAIQHGRFVEEENKRLPTALRPRPHLELQTGDLLITRAGPRARAGVACLIRSTRPRLMLCDKAYRLRAKPEVADPAFLEIALTAPHIVDAIDELKTGISDSGVNLTQRGFQGL